MSQSTRPDDINPTPLRRKRARQMRPGKSFPGLPVRGKHRNSDVSIWVLAICIAIALILRTTSDAESQETSPGYLLGEIEYFEDA